jgi:hypothetical protein
MDGQLPPKRIAIYAALQSLVITFCWLWFGVLWSIALFTYTMSDLEWWVLVATACAGVYGLRPNLERAIDTAWLQGVKTSDALTARVAQLRPVKRRIDVLFSIIVIVLVGVGTVIWLGLSGTA